MDSRLALALKYHDQHMPDEAWAALRGLVAEADVDPKILQFAATLRLQMQAYDDVWSLCDRISDAWSDGLKGHVLQALGRLEEAETAYRASLARAENNPAVWSDLGNVLDALGKSDAAKACFERAIAQDPTFAPAYTNLGAHVAGRGLFDLAASHYRRALESDPQNNAAALNLGVALVETGQIEAACEAFDQVLKRDPGNADAADNRLYAQIYTETDPSKILAAHAAWGRAQPVGQPIAPVDPNPHRRLRIGYVSPDFRRHSVAFFIEPLLANHDPAAVDVFCYADVARPDDVTARLKSYIPHWRSTQALTHAQLYEQIRNDRIDILVDLAGHTTGNRLPVFAHRAALIQVTGLGYPATTGLAAMDYRLCDHATDPAPNADAYATEKLMRLPSLHCYKPPADTPDVTPLPALKNGYVTFGSFNKLAKISSLTIDKWCYVLGLVKDSRLLLKSKALTEERTRASLASAFVQRGIAADRLEFLPWLQSDEAHLALYGRVDIALDTYPYNGTTTTCEAMWMGVPTLSRVGSGHAARVGASLLTRVGLEAWIVDTTHKLIAFGPHLASDLEKLATLRAGLRARMRASPLCDGKSYARNVEAAYREMWRRITGS